jgi:hypothetical protein
LTRQKAAALVLLCLVLIFFTPRIIWYIEILQRFAQVSPQLDPLPAPDEAPGNTTEPIIVGNLILNASGRFSGGMPHEGPQHLGFTLMINVTNIGDYDITDFQVVKVTIFWYDLSPIYSFEITEDENMTIISGSNEILNYDEDRYVPRGTIYFGECFLRVLVTFDNMEAIVTTPTSMGSFWIE